jgi:hypothetical protein
VTSPAHLDAAAPHPLDKYPLHAHSLLSLAKGDMPLRFRLVGERAFAASSGDFHLLGFFTQFTGQGEQPDRTRNASPAATRPRWPSRSAELRSGWLRGVGGEAISGRCVDGPGRHGLFEPAEKRDEDRCRCCQLQRTRNRTPIRGRIFAFEIGESVAGEGDTSRARRCPKRFYVPSWAHRRPPPRCCSSMAYFTTKQFMFQARAVEIGRSEVEGGFQWPRGAR